MGGILGLCTGFSIITAVEFFYWFSARIICDHRTKIKKISPELPKEEDASQEVSKGECQQCTSKLECEVKKLKSELGKQMEATKQQMEDNNKQQMEAIKQQIMEELKQQMDNRNWKQENNLKTC